MKTRHYIILLLCLVALLNPLSTFAQEEEEPVVISPYMELKYLKNTDNERLLNARVFDATALGEVALPGLTVKFYTNQEDMQLLGEAVTNSKGVASYLIPDDAGLPVDADNNWWFYAEFEGTDGIEMTMEEVTVMDVNLEMSVEESEEEGKIITLKAYYMLDGEQVPVTDEDIYVFVPRMFSLLQVGEGYFEDGVTTVEFPDDVPGDEAGNITVIGRFNDHWQFGNVEKRIDTDWGVPASHEIAETHRALWTQIAPLWMIITLTIMLAGVWGHYIYAFISLVRIKRASKDINVK